MGGFATNNNTCEECQELLKKHRLTQAWLADRLAKDRQIIISKQNLYSAINGTRNSRACLEALTASVEILREYDNWTKTK